MVVKILIVGVILPSIFGIYFKKYFFCILRENEITSKNIRHIVYIAFFNSINIGISLLLHYYFIFNEKYLNLLYLLSIWSIAFLFIGTGYQLLTDKYYSILNEKFDLKRMQGEMYKYVTVQSPM